VKRLLTVFIALASLSGGAAAQRGHPDSTSPHRAELERRFRERFEAVVKERVGLTDPQMRQLLDVNARFETRRRELFGRERALRVALRKALERGEDQATQDSVAGLLEQALRVQQQRLDLLEEENRALASFMTPVQRARYFGMQEQMRRRVDEMRRGRGGKDSVPPDGPRGLRRPPMGKEIPPRPGDFPPPRNREEEPGEWHPGISASR